MRAILVTLGLAGLVVAPGCAKEKKKDPAVKVEPPAEAPSGEPAAKDEAAGAGTTAIEGEKPTMANKMAHCPSAVPGAKTDVIEDNGKVVLTVTAEGEARVVEIQKRAEHLDKVATAPDAEVKHTGMGTGGGKSGRCPVVMTDVTLEIAKLENGVKISLSPNDAGAVGDLARMARERATAMASDGGGGHGDELGADEESGDNE
jgi:hypothetical protein